MKCLECGYEGLVPVVVRPWYTGPAFEWGGLILLWLIMSPVVLLMGLGFVGGLIFGGLLGIPWMLFLRSAARKGVRFQCPACQETLQWHG